MIDRILGAKLPPLLGHDRRQSPQRPVFTPVHTHSVRDKNELPHNPLTLVDRHHHHRSLTRILTKPLAADVAQLAPSSLLFPKPLNIGNIPRLPQSIG